MTHAMVGKLADIYVSIRSANVRAETRARSWKILSLCVAVACSGGCSGGNGSGGSQMRASGGFGGALTDGSGGAVAVPGIGSGGVGGMGGVVLVVASGGSHAGGTAGGEVGGASGNGGTAAGGPVTYPIGATYPCTNIMTGRFAPGGSGGGQGGAGTAGAGGVNAAGGAGGADAGPGSAISTMTCVVGQSFCQQTIIYGSIPGDIFQQAMCISLNAQTAACADVPSCACITSHAGYVLGSVSLGRCECSEDSGFVRVTCAGI